MKIENDNLEKCIQKLVKSNQTYRSNNSPTPNNDSGINSYSKSLKQFEHNFSVACSPYAKLKRQADIYNSPKFLSQLACPISPPLDSPSTNSKGNGKSVDSDSPIRKFNVLLNEPTNNATSTPEDQRPSQKAQDESLKQALKQDSRFFSQYRFLGDYSKDENKQTSFRSSKSFLNSNKDVADVSISNIAEGTSNNSDVCNENGMRSIDYSYSNESSGDGLFWKTDMKEMSPCDSLAKEMSQVIVFYSKY